MWGVLPLRCRVSNHYREQLGSLKKGEFQVLLPDAKNGKLKDVGEMVGVHILDHLIIAKGCHVCFVDDGYWK